MPKTLFNSIAVRGFGAACAATLLVQCGPNPQMVEFSNANNLESISVPYTGEVDLKALDCAATDYAVENGFSRFAPAKVTMQVRGGFKQSPSVLTNPEGDQRLFGMYGFYRSEADWSAAKDERIETLRKVSDRAEFCGLS